MNEIPAEVHTIIACIIRVALTDECHRFITEYKKHFHKSLYRRLVYELITLQESFL